MARALGQGHDDDDHAFHGQLLAVTDDDITDVTDAETVDKDPAGIDVTRLMTGTIGKFENLSIVANEYMILFYPHLYGQFAVTAQHPVFPVDRNEILRFDQAEHYFQLFLAGMTGYMHFFIPAGNDVSAELHEIVDSPAYACFITRNRCCGNDDRIARHNAHAAVIVRSHAGQAGHRFTLAARRQDQYLIGRIAVQFIRFNEDAFRHFQIAQFNGDLDIVDHTAAQDSDFALKQDGRIDGLLNTGDIRRKGCQNNAALGVSKGLAEGRADGRFRFRVARPFGVGTIGHEQQYAAPSEIGKLMQIHGHAVYWCQIHLEVACMDNRSYRCTEIQGAGIGNGMVRMNEPYLNTADLHFVAMMYFI